MLFAKWLLLGHIKLLFSFLTRLIHFIKFFRNVSILVLFENYSIWQENFPLSSSEIFFVVRCFLPDLVICFSFVLIEVYSKSNLSIITLPC